MTNTEATVAADFRAPESAVDGVKIGKVLSITPRVTRSP